MKNCSFRNMLRTSSKLSVKNKINLLKHFINVLDFSPTVEETAQCYNTVVHNSGSETDVTYVVKLVRITLIDRKCLVNKIILYMKIKKIIIIPILGI